MNNKYFEYTSKFGTKWNVMLVKVESQEANDPRIRLELVSDMGEPVACATVQLEAFQTTEDLLIIKNYSENEGMYEWLKENDFVDGGSPLYLPPYDAECRLCNPTKKLRESWVIR